jgi:hypothetical protein
MGYFHGIVLDVDGGRRATAVIGGWRGACLRHHFPRHAK